jgi:hypothetical protein
MQPINFKSVLGNASISTQGIRGVILTDIIWDTGDDISHYVNNDAFASYYKTDNVIVEWSVRLVDKRSGFYMQIEIQKISGNHICEFLERDDVDDQEIEFEFNDDLDSKWELKAESFYDSKEFRPTLPHAMFPKGLAIDYDANECVIYFGR